jgi:hypothetical protein
MLAAKNIANRKRPGDPGYISVSRKWHKEGTRTICCKWEGREKDRKCVSEVEIDVYLTIARFEKDGKVKYEPQVYMVIGPDRADADRRPKDDD